MNNNVKIFYTPNGEEIKNSLVRYIRFVKGLELSAESFVDISKFVKKKYFDEIYPANFDNCELYFIFDEDLDVFKNDKSLTESGLIFSIIVDLSHSSTANRIKINLFKSDLNEFKIYNKIKFSEESEKSEESFLVRIEKEIIIEEFERLFSIMGHFHSISEKDLNNIEKILESVPKNQNNSEKKGDNENTKTNEKLSTSVLECMVKDSIFVLIIDDVLGNYEKTFLPFYVWMKSKINKKLLIMRGLYDPLPENLVNTFRHFPADVILVDIDFQEMGEKWEADPAYKFYYSEGKNSAGAILYKSLNAFKKTGVFVKEPEIKIFTGLTQLKSKIEQQGFLKNEKKQIEKLIEFIDNYPASSYYNDHEIFKKIVFLKKYILNPQKYIPNPQINSWIKIWDAITLTPKPIPYEESGYNKSDNEEWRLIDSNYTYFDKHIKNHISDFYTGLEDIEFNGDLKPIIGERIKKIEKCDKT